MNETKKPPFVREYSTEGATLWVHGGTGVGEVIVREFLRKLFPDVNLNLMIYAGFWILEGVLYAHELTGEQYESLSYYLAERESLDMQGRWKLYCNVIDESIVTGLLFEAYNTTRRHVMETMAEMPLEDKKKSSKTESSK